MKVQAAVAAKTGDAPERARFDVHSVDIIVADGSRLDDGIYVAARLQKIAVPGGVCLSIRVPDDVRDQLDTAFEDGGGQSQPLIVIMLPL